MTTYKAVPVGELKAASGRLIEMEPGPCLWCNEWVESKRDEAGATNPFDPCWATTDGDYGCDSSPESNDEGCGNHARPYDLALAMLKLERNHDNLRKSAMLVVNRWAHGDLAEAVRAIANLLEDRTI